jgi:hypothetical protein
MTAETASPAAIVTAWTTGEHDAKFSHQMLAPSIRFDSATSISPFDALFTRQLLKIRIQNDMIR